MNRLYNNLRKIVCVSLLFVVISDFGLAQNIKKVYKQITKKEIGDANNELKQFSTASLDNKELTLYDLANCLVLCNPLLTNNDPFKSNGMFEKIDFTKSSKSEVNDFLEKFDLSIDKIHDTIYTRILDYAKKQNTEASYTSALTVCTNCFYKGEVTKLQVNSAYNETIKKASISGYKEFISKYPNSEYRNEIQRLEETLAFSNAKSKNSLIGFKNYIEGYSSTSNQYLSLAINLRDSIVFFTLNQNYADFKTFIKENPKSKYSPLAQQALPKLLFNQALKDGSIDLYKRFLVEFPIDTRKDSVLFNLEKLELEKLVAKPSIEEIELFKRNYPNTRYMQRLDELVEELYTDVLKVGKKDEFERIKEAFTKFSPQISFGNEINRPIIDPVFSIIKDIYSENEFHDSNVLPFNLRLFELTNEFNVKTFAGSTLSYEKIRSIYGNEFELPRKSQQNISSGQLFSLTDKELTKFTQFTFNNFRFQNALDNQQDDHNLYCKEIYNFDKFGNISSQETKTREGNSFLNIDYEYAANDILVRALGKLTYNFTNSPNPRIYQIIHQFEYDNNMIKYWLFGTMNQGRNYPTIHLFNYTYDNSNKLINISISNDIGFCLDSYLKIHEDILDFYNNKAQLADYENINLDEYVKYLSDTQNKHCSKSFGKLVTFSYNKEGYISSLATQAAEIGFYYFDHSIIIVKYKTTSGKRGNDTSKPNDPELATCINADLFVFENINGTHRLKSKYQLNDKFECRHVKDYSYKWDNDTNSNEVSVKDYSNTYDVDTKIYINDGKNIISEKKGNIIYKYDKNMNLISKENLDCNNNPADLFKQKWLYEYDSQGYVRNLYYYNSYKSPYELAGVTKLEYIKKD